jgi:PAS domain S-box-containing protein
VTRAAAAERLRQQALRRLQILDTPPEPDFDALARLAAHVCGAPIALLTLLDGDRQWFKAHLGIKASQTPREQAFCDHAVADGDALMVVPDARADPRFSLNPLVTGEPHVRFYAGAPLVTDEGVGLGTLCVVDRVPRTLSPEQGEALRMLARQAVAQMELRAHVRAVAALQAEQLAEAERTARTQAALTELARLDKTDLHAALRAITRVAAHTLGVERVGVWLFEEGGDELACACLYRLSADAHEEGMRIRAADAPAYFAALRESPTLAAEDAMEDPRTREFADGYLRPLGIGAMLDVPVWRGGTVAGVLCHEHVGGPRAWNHEEQDLAAGAAAMAAIAVEVAERRASEAEARRTAARMRAVAGAAAGVVGAGSVQRLRQVVHDACSLVVPFDEFSFTVSEGHTAVRLPGVALAAAPAVDGAQEGEADTRSHGAAAVAAPASAPGLNGGGAGEGPPAAGNGGGAALEVPLTGAGGRVLGTLALRGAASTPTGPEDRQVVEAIASLAAVALEGIRTQEERRRAEEALRASEESYRTIFELAADAVFVHDPETGEILDANRQACELHGCSLERLKELGVPGISDGAPPFDGSRARARVRAAAAGRPQRFEWRVRDAAGAPVWVEVSLHAVTIRGEPRVLASVRSIGERKAAEEALRRLNDELEARVGERTAELAQANLALEEEVAERTAAEEELRGKTRELEAVFRALPDLYFRLDAEGALLDYEASARDPLFVPGADCVGRGVDDVFPPALAAALERGMAEMARTGELVCVEDVLPGAEGDERHFEARLLPFSDGQTIVVVRDITDRARAERALQAREEHFRRIIENSSDVATILSPEGVNVYQSPSIERVFGYRAEEMVGTSAFERIHPDDHAAARRTLGEVFRAPGRSVAAEFRYRHADGSWRWAEALARTLHPGTADAGVIVNVRDVTDRRQAQDALHRSEALFRSVVENITDLVTLMEPDGTIRYQSPSIGRIFGYAQDELVGTVAFDLVHPDDLPEVLGRFQEILEHPGEPRQAAFRFRDARGEWRFVESVAATLSPAGPREGVVVNTRDVTERRQGQLALEETTRFLENLVASSPGVIFRGSGQTFRTTYISPNALDVLGFSAERFLGDPHLWVERTHPDDREGVREKIARAVREGAAELAYEYRFLHGRGEYVNLLASTRFVRDGGGGVEVIGYTLDVSPLKEAEAALRAAMLEAQAARDAAQAANRAKSEFLSRMSHELRTPMNSILGFAQLMARQDPTAQQRRSVEQILRAGRHLLNLINEVLDLARIESNRQPLSLEPVPVDAAVAEAVSLIRPLAAEHDCRLQEPATMPGVHVRADRQRLAQVLLNLLSNAVKYNRPGGSVRVSVRDVAAAEGGAGTVRIAVHDTGRGIAPEQMAELFVPFARLGAESSGVEGTGLGLALSRRLAEAMDGSLAAESEPGVGSTFTLELPRESDPLERLPRPPAEGAPREAEATHGRAATLLYIEDNLANLSLIETLLASRPEITLLTAMQGRMGMYLAWEQAPDLILLDLHLPDLAGDEVLRRLRTDERTARTRVVVISADATPGRMQRLRAAGADDYLTKPLDLDAFLETVDRLLEAEGGNGAG